jgi:hypothetical protein
MPAGNRSIPDVAMIAGTNTPVAVYDSYDGGAATPWIHGFGTSLGTPCWAGLVAIVNQEVQASRLGTPILGGWYLVDQLRTLGGNVYHDITTGNNGFPATPGYDLVTGKGTPKAPQLVNSMVAFPSPCVMLPPVQRVVAGAHSEISLGLIHDLAARQDPNAQAEKFVINWGDGTPVQTTYRYNQTGTIWPSEFHTYRNVGTYDLSVVIYRPDYYGETRPLDSLHIEVLVGPGAAAVAVAAVNRGANIDLAPAALADSGISLMNHPTAESRSHGDTQAVDAVLSSWVRSIRLRRVVNDRAAPTASEGARWQIARASRA